MELHEKVLSTVDLPVATLVTQVGTAAGNRAAEAEIYARLAQDVRRWARDYTNSMHDAEDLAGECWELALRKLRVNALRDPNAIRGFLRGVVRRLAARDRRRQAVQLEIADTGIIETMVQATDEQPERQVAGQQDLDLAAHALAGLRVPRDREVLVLLLEGKSPARVADDVGMSSDQLHKVACRARHRLRTSLLQLQPLCDWGFETSCRQGSSPIVLSPAGDT